MSGERYVVSITSGAEGLLSNGQGALNEQREAASLGENRCGMSLYGCKLVMDGAW